MLSFSPAIGERKYDWEKKQVYLFVDHILKLLISVTLGTVSYFILLLTCTKIISDYYRL